MEAIKKLVLTPEWWFSAVIVAILTGVASTFAKDWLTSSLSNLSRSYRARAQRKAEERARHIALLVSHPPLLAIEFQRMVFYFLCWIFILGCTLVFPTVLLFLSSMPTPTGEGRPYVAGFAVLIAFALLLLAVLYLVRLIGWLILCRDARWALYEEINRKRRGQMHD